MKRMKCLMIMFLLSSLLVGCQEIENPDFAEKQINQQPPIVEGIDLSDISAPEEVSVYSAALWEKKAEEIAGVFLGNDFKEGETHAEGRAFVKDAGSEKERGVNVIDGGMAYFGELGHAADNGVNFWRKDDGDFEQSISYEEMSVEYGSTGGISSGGPDEENLISDLEKTVLEYLDQTGMEGYELDAAALLDDKEWENRKGCLMFWKQVVDGIPLSDTLYENSGNMTNYNYRHQIYNSEFQTCTSTLKIFFWENELTDWYNLNIIRPDKKLKTYSPVSAVRAYEKVRECYPSASGEGEPPSLERAEFQYQIVKNKGNYYLYPIWLFGVYKKTEDGGPDWVYYMIDGVSGDFFSDIPEELLK